MLSLKKIARKGLNLITHSLRIAVATVLHQAIDVWLIRNKQVYRTWMINYIL